MNKQNLIKFFLLAIILVLTYVFCKQYRNLYKKYVRTKNEYIDKIDKIDISKQKIEKCNFNRKDKFNIWLTSYADGPEANFGNQWILNYSAFNRCVDFFIPKTYKHLDAEFIKKNQHILSQKRGAGYWLWKPYIIDEALKNIPEGDILLYVDSGIKLTENVDKLINLMDDKNIAAIGLKYDCFKTGRSTKRELLEYMDMDNDEVKKTAQIQAALIAVVNNSVSRKIIKEWLELARHENLITDTPSKKEEYSYFEDHRHDQAIFSLLAIKYKNEFKILPYPYDKSTIDSDIYNYHHHRRRSLEQKSLLFN